MKTGKIRTSARQAAARQRIRQIDNPSGSAPPFEQGVETSGWTINPGRHEERRLLETMIKHLQDDPMETMDASVLRFVYKEWPTLAPSMNTKTTVRNVKKRLQAMDIAYIHRTSENDWLFWNDYSIDGMFNVTPLPDKQEHSNNTRGIEDTMSQASESEDTSQQDDGSVADVGDQTQQHYTEYMHDSNVNPEDMKYDQYSTDDISQDNPNDQEGSDTSVSPTTNIHAITTPVSTVWKTEQLNSSDSDSASADSKTPHIQTPHVIQGTPIPHRGKYTRNTSATRHAIVQPVNKGSSENQHTSIAFVPTQLDTDDDEGFLPVTNRKRNKYKNQAKDITEYISPHGTNPSPHNPMKIDLVTPRDTGKTPPTVDLVTPPKPTADINRLRTIDLTTTPPQPRTEMNTITTFSDILNDRIQEAMLEVDRRAHAMDDKQARYEAKLRSYHRKHEALRAKDDQRLQVRESLLNQWEAKMALRARDHTDMEHRAALDLAQREQDLTRLHRRTQEALDEHKRTIDNITIQNELAIRAWHEVEMQKFKDKLAEHQSDYKARTEDFCEEQLQNLESNLDSYAEHARGIQEKLLV